MAGTPVPQEKRAQEKRIEERPKQEKAFRLAPARKTWARIYGDASDDYALSIAAAADGGYVVAGGARRQTWVTTVEAAVLKLSSEGEIEWQYAYPGIEEASCIKQAADGGYIVCGTTAITDTDDSDFWLLKIDPAGAPEWQRTYGRDGDDRAHSVWPAADGGFAVAGTTESLPSGNKDAWILRLSSAGDIEWQGRFGSAGDDVVESVIQTADGGLVAAGHRSERGTGSGDFLAFKLTPTGALEWQVAFGGEKDDRAHSVIQTRDQGYLLAGEISPWVAVVKLSPSGDIEWQRFYWSPAGYTGFARSAEPTGDGGYIISGTVYADGGGRDMLLMKLTSDGGIHWQFGYGRERAGDAGQDIELLSDGGIIVAGKTQAFGAETGDILVLRLDEHGQIDRLPEILGVASLRPEDVALEVRRLALGPRLADAVALPASIPYFHTGRQTTLVFAPPYLSGKRFLNRSLSQAEYVDSLTWEPNPNNSDLNIVAYRLYLYDYYNEERQLAELSPQSRTFMVRNVKRDAWHLFSLAGVTDKGEEGMRAFLDIRDVAREP